MKYIVLHKLVLASDIIEFNYAAKLFGQDVAPRYQCWTNKPLDYGTRYKYGNDPQGNGAKLIVKPAQVVDGVTLNVFEFPEPVAIGPNWLHMNMPNNGGAEEINFDYQRVAAPPTDPAPPAPPAPSPVRADTAVAAAAAIASGAKWIQTSGLDISSTFDAKGALIELLFGGPSWKAAVNLNGKGKLLNATVRTPLSTYSASGERTQFWKAIAVSSNADATISNVTIAADAGFCIHNFGKLTVENTWASTFSDYFYFGEEESYVSMQFSGYRGGSRAESGFRVAHGRYLVEDCVFDNSGGGKAAMRGDSPAWPDGSPGGIVRRTKLVGNVGLNPLTEDDGGQMMGIDRWRVVDKWIVQPGIDKAVALAYAKSLKALGKSRREVVIACADRFLSVDQLMAYAGKAKLTASDIDLTLDYRKTETHRQSKALIEDSEIEGSYRICARMDLTVKRTPITGDQPISGNSQATYPWPIDRVLDSVEVAPPAVVTFEVCTFSASVAVGMDLAMWPSV